MNLKKIFIIGLGLCLSMMAQADPVHYMEMHKKPSTVAITMMVERLELTQAYEGIIAGLKAEGYQESENLKIIYKNANGDLKMADQIAEDFVTLKPDLMIPISTASAQAIINADKKAQIPVVFTAITDPVAAKLVPSLIQPGGHVTGVYDFPPIVEQVKLMYEISPQIKNLGIIYNTREINSIRMVEELIKALPASINIVKARVDSSKDVTTATDYLLGKVDAIYIPSDNTVVANIKEVLNVTMEHKIPVYTSEQGTVELGALAAIAFDQYEVGYMAGRMAGQILYGKKAGTLDVVKPLHAFTYINTQTAAKLAIQLPEHILKSAVLM